MTIDRVVHLDGITMEEVVVSITVITIHICSVSSKIKGMGPKIMIKKKDIKIKVIKTHISNFRIKTDSAISKINSISRIATIINKEMKGSRSIILKISTIKYREIKLIVMYPSHKKDFKTAVQVDPLLEK